MTLSLNIAHESVFVNATMFFYYFARQNNVLECSLQTVLAVLLLGQAGTGKTMCLKYWAYWWAHSRDPTHTVPEDLAILPENIDLLIYIDKTHEKSNWKKTFMQAVDGDENEKKEAWTMLKDTNTAKRIAIFIDGINEFKSSKILKEIFRLVRRCHLAISCRSNPPVLKHRELEGFLQVEVIGIDPGQKSQFINNYLPKDSRETAETLISKLDRDDNDFWGVPVNLLFLCKDCGIDANNISLGNYDLCSRHQTYILKRESEKFPLGFWIFRFIYCLWTDLVLTLTSKHVKGLLKAVKDLMENGGPSFEEKQLIKHGASRKSRSLVLLPKTGPETFKWPYKYPFQARGESMMMQTR